jgi:hypothetical protein
VVAAQEVLVLSNIPVWRGEIDAYTFQDHKQCRDQLRYSTELEKQVVKVDRKNSLMLTHWKMTNQVSFEIEYFRFNLFSTFDSSCSYIRPHIPLRRVP